MTRLLDAGIGMLVEPIGNAFDGGKADFWAACRKQDASIRIQVAEGPFLREVEAALLFLDANEQAAPLLGDLLLARPGHAALRRIVGQVFQDALAVVSDARFQVEAQIQSTLSGPQAQSLRNSLDQIDSLLTAVTAYKSMHDSLHLLQPLLSLLRGAAASRARWPEVRLTITQFRMSLGMIEKAASDLAAMDRGQQLGFRQEIVEALDMLEQGLSSELDYDVRDAASQMSSTVERSLDTVDVMMLAAAEEASAPVGLALEFLAPLAGTTASTPFGQLVTSYLEFAREVSAELSGAIREHGRWQQLDRQFDRLQRIIVENQAGAVGEVDTIWRLTQKQLDTLCTSASPPPWAVSIVNHLCLARSELVPPIPQPVADQARDRISALISNGRGRFMEVDRALLDWLSRSAGKQPELMSLLRGHGHG